MKNTLQTFKIITLAIVLSFGLSYVYAWTAPTVSAPGGNTSAPINTSLTSQYKSGALGIGGVIQGFSDAFFGGNVGIGTTTPGYKLDVNGDINIAAGSVYRIGGIASAGGGSKWGMGTGDDIHRALGNVGIGTTNPGARLEVVGDIISKGTSWTSRTSAADNTWNSVTYANDLFVAVGDQSTGTSNVMTSPDGINWTNRTSPISAWKSVTYGNGLFVAVGPISAGTQNVMTSTGGIFWTNRTATSSAWSSVTYGNGLFVAVAGTNGNNRSIMSSTDGIIWTLRGNTTHDWRSVTYGNGLFVAVGEGSITHTTNVMTSIDGISWAYTTATQGMWNSVTYGNGLFVALGSQLSGKIMTSPDGINWTDRTATSGSWRSVTYGNGLFVAVGQSSLSTVLNIITSPDGINWTNRTEPANNNWRSVTYGNGLFVAVSSTGTGNRVMTSGKSEFTGSDIYSGVGTQLYSKHGDVTIVASHSHTWTKTSTGDFWNCTTDTKDQYCEMSCITIISQSVTTICPHTAIGGTRN